MSRGQEVNFLHANMEMFIYNSMRLARYDVTKEACAAGLDESTEEGKALQNFRNAYRYLIDTPDREIDYPYLCELHHILMEGLMDSVNNELTDEQIVQVREMINQPAKANTEIAIDVMLYILEKRLFADGDVRVALMFANKILLENGNGIISIPESRDNEFRAFLKGKHSMDDPEAFKSWVFTWCLRGIKNDY